MKNPEQGRSEKFGRALDALGTKLESSGKVLLSCVFCNYVLR